jgi:ABC-type sugar transport system substrate-binding protein
VWYTNNFVENAYAIADELMAKHPNLGGFLAMNEVSTVGVARALGTGAGRTSGWWASTIPCSR